METLQVILDLLWAEIFDPIVETRWPGRRRIARTSTEPHALTRAQLSCVECGFAPTSAHFCLQRPNVSARKTAISLQAYRQHGQYGGRAPHRRGAGASGAYGHGLRDLAEFSRDPCRRTARSPHKRNPGQILVDDRPR